MQEKKWRKAFGMLLAGSMLLTSIPISAQENVSVHAETLKQFEVTNLTTEYLTNPIGIDTDTIRFGWQMDSQVIGAMQSAYQVQVFETDTDELVWDSEKTENSLSTGIMCEEKLDEATASRWEVTVWNEDDTSVTAGAYFETGVTNQQEWKDAEFIRLTSSSAAPIFRTEQDLEGTDIEKARLYITALGAYEAYVNGNRVGEWKENGEMIYHHMNPGYGNKTVSLGYQTYDVTPFLKGEETVALSAVAGNGWYYGLATTNAQPAIKALLVVDFEDGSRQVIDTNTSDWKGTLAGGITGNGVYYGEDYNAVFAEALGDFTQVGYDDSAWVSSKGVEDTNSGIPCIVNKFEEQTASYIRILVEETGPAIAGVNEHFLQLMELEVLDSNSKNVVAGVVPNVSNTWSPNAQWSPNHLTDGDLGTDSDYGYTTTLLGTQGRDSFVLSDPISITFELDKEVSIDTLKMYPRVSEVSVSGTDCANYPKQYRIQVSDNGTNWTDAGETYRVESLRNTIKYPESDALNYGVDFGETLNAKHVRMTVTETGAATGDDNENRLQIMELELLDGAANVVKGVVPTISNNFEAGSQWNAANMTDGSYGTGNDAGYTSDILGYGATFLKLPNPITIQFDFDNEVSFSEMKIYPRTGKEAVTSGLCVNYPKTYTVQISDDGKTWNDVVVEQDHGVVRNTTLIDGAKMSATTYPGVIRAQVGIPGRLIDTYDQYPVSAVLYSGTKPNSSYPGGEIEVDVSYEGAELKDAWEDGIILETGQTMIVNMGQNLTAVPNIRFEAPLGTVATMKFAEMLNDGSSVGNGATQADGPKGSIYQKSLRAARSAVTYVFAGNDIETYQPGMSFFGYQYVEITASDDIIIYGLTSKAISSVTEQTGNIRTNNEDVNKLFSNVTYGQLSNYFTTPTDCNQRDERLSWTGDTQAFAQTAVYNFDSMAFLNEIQDIYKENTWIMGYVPMVADDLTGYFNPWCAGWSDALIIVPWVMYQQTGDISILEDNWDTLVHYMDYMKRIERGTNLAPTPNTGRNTGDWLSFQGTSIEVINDYYYGYVHQIMIQIAGILGETEKEEEYSEKFEALKEKFIETHVEFDNGDLVIKSKEGNTGLQFQYGSGKEGVWENNSQTSLLWMLKLGYYDSDEMKEAAEQLLLENVKNENPVPNSVRAKYGENTLAVGFLGSNVITPVLSDLGYSSVSYDLLLQDEQPSWLFEVKAGATTVWERWNSYTPGVGFGHSEMNSFNHYAYGSVVEWMYRYMAGIASDIKNPGFKNVILQPTMDKGEYYNDQERIECVDASYDSYYGTIVSNWEGYEGQLKSFHTEIPANTTATLYLPVEESAMEGFDAPEGVVYKGMEEHNGEQTAKVLLKSGGYDFVVKQGKVTVSYAEGYVNEIEAPALPYTDVEDGIWYYDAVYYNYLAGTMTGKSETIFAPDESLARGQFASILYRINGSPAITFTPEFSDVEKDIWYTAPILWAKSTKIVNGYADGRFGPGDMITREQMAIMMYNYAVHKGYDVTETNDLSAFKDAGSVSGYALEEVQWAVGAGIISGKENGTILDPQGETARAQCAVIIKNFTEKYEG